MSGQVKIDLDEEDDGEVDVEVKPWYSHNSKSKTPDVRIRNRSDKLDIVVHFPNGSPFALDTYSLARKGDKGDEVTVKVRENADAERTTETSRRPRPSRTCALTTILLPPAVTSEVICSGACFAAALSDAMGSR